MKSIAILSVIFPNNLKYFERYLQSLSTQTIQNFTLIIGNDGCLEGILRKKLDSYSFNFEIVEIKNMTPSENRMYLINYILRLGFKYIIFGDTDDFFSTDRIYSIKQKFCNEKADIVVNNIVNVSENNDTFFDTNWSYRLRQITLDYKTLLKFNFLGLGNTAIRTSLLNKKFVFNRDISVFDWMFFVQLLYYNQPKISISFSTTYYRQHSNNTLGLSILHNYISLSRLIEIKMNFLEYCISIGINDAVSELESLMRLKVNLKNDLFRHKYIFKLNHNKKLFWFEETVI